MGIEAILFDMDGVLVDVSQSYRYAIKKTAEFFTEEEIQYSEIQEFKNKGGYNNDWECTHAIISAHNKDVYSWEVVDKFQEFYLGKNFNGFVLNEIWLLNHQILDSLHFHYKLGIVTGRPKKEAEFVLARFDVAEYFDVIITLDDTPLGKRKPEPYGILQAIKKLNIHDAIYLGDTIDDMKAATSAQIISVGLLTDDYRSQQQIDLLKNNGAIEVLNSVNDVLEFLNEKHKI